MPFFALFLLTASAHAAGFEKAQSWSAKAAAMGGAVVGSTRGAEALYFNPAGLALSPTRGEVSVNFSPTFSKFSGVNPYSQAGSVSGASGFSPVMGILAAFRPIPRLGIGLGYYVSGGTQSKFENLDYAGSSPLSSNFDTLKPTVETSLAMTEIALGAGYYATPNLRFGLAIRRVNVSGKFSTVNLTPNTALAEITIDDIAATKWTAYKLGAQYESTDHRWGLGLGFRSAVKFTATGTTSGRVETTSADVASLGTGTAELDNTFPMQITFGGWTRATELFRLGWEYSYTNYAQNQTLEIRGNVGAQTLSSIPQRWKNMNVARLGGEYTGMGLPLRFGYSYTTAVTPADYARSTFSSPGPGHSITFGSGMILSRAIELDGALEYAFASGTATNINTPSTVAEVGTASAFKSTAYAAHLSARYRF